MYESCDSANFLAETRRLVAQSFGQHNRPARRASKGGGKHSQQEHAPAALVPCPHTMILPSLEPATAPLRYRYLYTVEKKDDILARPLNALLLAAPLPPFIQTK